MAVDSSATLRDQIHEMRIAMINDVNEVSLSRCLTNDPGQEKVAVDEPVGIEAQTL
jgi:hypothetical protein